MSESDIDMIESVNDSEAVIKKMDNMSIAELKMLKAACDFLIGCKENP